MKTIPEDLAAHLAGDATSVCLAWKVTRRDGSVIGFTEHDRPLSFAGAVFLAASGFKASADEATTGLAADAGDVAGGFSSEAITESDLRAGRYDGARVETFLVNWQAPAQHVLLRVQEIGEVTRSGEQFRAELRRTTHRLDRVQGRIYARRCDAVLGNARCGVDLQSTSFRRTGTITAVLRDTLVRVSGLDGSPADFFRYGVIAFTSGANAGRTVDIEGHRIDADGAALSLWLPLPVALEAGDGFVATAGCDKSFATCGAKFSNRLNFQGVPHMPGADFAYGYADADTVHDGRPLYA